MKNIISEISQEERDRILEMHKKATTNQFLVSEEIETPAQVIPKVGMSAVGYLQDEAEGYNFIVQKVTPITECGITELELVTKQGGRPRYGYYKDNDVESIKRFGERVKSNNPCVDWDSMDNFGALKFS